MTRPMMPSPPPPTARRPPMPRWSLTCDVSSSASSLDRTRVPPEVSAPAAAPPVEVAAAGGGADAGHVQRDAQQPGDEQGSRRDRGPQRRVGEVEDQG